MGTTTALALPYPEGADPPDGATQIRALAEAVDGALGTPPAASAQRSVSSDNVSPADGAWLEVAVDQTTHTVGGMTLVSGRAVKVPNTGLYRVAFNLRVSCAAADAQLGAQAARNGNTVSPITAAFGDSGAANRTQTLSAASLTRLNADDQVSLFILGNGHIQAVRNLTGLVVEWIAA